MRLFIAVKLDHLLETALSKKLKDWSSRYSGVKWVGPENMHFTIAFLGECDPVKIKNIESAMRYCASKHRVFRSQLGRPGFFPDQRRPQIIWLGLNQGGAAFKQLGQDCRQALINQQFNLEKKSFIPHLTIGRVKKQQRFDEWERFIKQCKIPADTFEVDRMFLIQSHLKPSGPDYTVLDEVRLMNH